MEDSLYQEKLQDYLSGKLSHEEEKSLEELWQKKPQYLEEAEIELLNRYTIRKMSMDLHARELGERLSIFEGKRKTRRLTTFSSMAAAIALLIAIFLLVPSQKSSPETLFASHYAPLPAPENKSLTETDILQEAHVLYNQQKYEEAKQLYIESLAVSKDPQKQSSAYLYLGLCYLEAEEPQKAINNFQKATENPTSAHWYIAFAKLKQGQLEEARIWFEKIQSSEDNFYAGKARKILIQWPD